MRSNADASSAAREAAVQLVQRIGDDPVAVDLEARALLRDERRPAVRSILLRAAGLAARSVSTVDESIDLLEAASAAAEEVGDLDLREAAQLSLSGSLALAGQLSDALDVLGPDPAGESSRAPVWVFQRATILARAGRSREALPEFDRAIVLLEAADDPFFLAAARGNRGRLHLEVGDYDAAQSDLDAAHQAHRAQGDRLAAASMLHNLGELAALRGDLIDALRLLGESRDELEALTHTPWEPEVARCEVLLEAGLFTEARQLAERLVALMSDANLDLDRAEALLLAGRAMRALDDQRSAMRAATEAGAVFAEQGRPAWERRATLVRLQSSPADDVAASAELADAAVDLAEAAESTGQDTASIEARAEAVIRFCGAGRLEDARRHLDELTRAVQPRRGDHQILVATVRAIVFAAAGDRSGALRSIRRAIAAAEQHRLAFGATELALASANHERTLHQLAADLVVDGSNSDTVFTYTELARAASLRTPMVSRLHDEDRDRLVAQIRANTRAIDRADDAHDVARSTRELARNARSLRQLEQTRPAVERPGGQRVELREARGAIASNREAVLSLFEASGRLRAQLIGRSRTTLLDLGSISEWHQQFAAVASSLQLAAHGFTVLDEELDAAVEAIDTRLEAAIGKYRSVVIVPPRALLDAPWGVLPSLRLRPFVISPSVHVWHARASSRNVPQRCVSIAGPDLRHADEEAERVASIYPGGEVVRGAEANALLVRERISSNDVVHIACHGTHRRGNAMMSSLSLADGPLLLAELEGVVDIAPIIVLSSCASADFDSFGGETMGFVHTLLRHGCSTVVAGSGAIADTPDTVELMTRLHRHLAEGSAPATALLHARSGLPTPIAASFSCYGSGE